LDAIDDFIAPIKREIPWGYSVPYALSGKYRIHRTYPEYLLKKNRLKTKDIQRILRMVDKDHIEMFDEAYIEDLYRQYVSVDYDDSQSRNWLSSQIEGQNIVVLCPGRSLAENTESILAEIRKSKAIVFSVNFIPGFISPDYVFCANVKRLPNIVDSSGPVRLITSNLIEAAEDNYERVFSFNDCVYFNEEFCEDSTLMLLKILMECGCERISIAGFDGFQTGTENYYIPQYTREEGTNVSTKKVTHILTNALDKLNIRFLTPSAYQTET
jgi:4-hydroxy 2-oxovalerate aldolase